MATEKNYIGRIIINKLIWFILGVYCVGCAIFWSSFAEQKIDLSFLNFPIFIGEILLAICITLLCIHWKMSGFQFNKRYYFLLLAYLIWVLAKAFHGYFTMGPLAFRNAALFYYPFFAVIAYNFYEKKLFGQSTILLLLLIIFVVKMTVGFYIYFMLPSLILLLILISKVNNKWLRYPLFILGFILFQWKDIFFGSKAYVVGNIAAAIFLAFSATFLATKSWKKIAAVFFVIFVFIALGTYRYMDKHQLKSLTGFGSFVEQFKEKNALIEKQKIGYQPKELASRLYNREKIGFLSTVSERIGETRQPLASYDEPNTSAALNAEADIKQDATSEKILATVERRSQETKLETIREIRANIELLDLVLRGDIASVEGQEKASAALEESTQKAINDALTSIDQHKQQVIADVVKSSKQPKSNTQGSTGNAAYKEAMKSIDAYKQEAIKEAIAAIRIEMGKPSNKKTIQKEDRPRVYDNDLSNMLFRVFIWKDMLEELKREKPIFGFNFGKPQRSVSIEVLGQAWGEWMRDGWIAPHNSYLHLVYRGGIVGLMVIIGLFAVFIILAKKIFALKSIMGVLFLGIFVYWLTLINFLVFLELPYHAIPFWSLIGMVLAHFNRQELSVPSK